MGKIFNRKDQSDKRRLLRNNMTKAETLLWQHLKNKQIHGCKFRRQFSIAEFVVDNYSPEIKLAIEVDGVTHLSIDEIEYDKRRQYEIENAGITFLRFTNSEIFENIPYEIDCISNKVLELQKKTPSSR
jgi:very-short-patch-repair endonuclease